VSAVDCVVAKGRRQPKLSTVGIAWRSQRDGKNSLRRIEVREIIGTRFLGHAPASDDEAVTENTGGR
jgi:hypothetical protein